MKPISELPEAKVLTIKSSGSEAKFVRDTIINLIEDGKGSHEIRNNLEDIGFGEKEIQNALYSEDFEITKTIIDLLGALAQEELVSDLSAINEEYVEGYEDIIDILGNKVIEEESSEFVPDDDDGRRLSYASYTEVTSESCEAHGYETVASSNECEEAAAQQGRIVTWGPHGGYIDVVTGCSARIIRSNTHLFFNNPGVCNPNDNKDRWTHTSCKCTTWMPCLCKAPASVRTLMLFFHGYATKVHL